MKTLEDYVLPSGWECKKFGTIHYGVDHEKGQFSDFHIQGDGTEEQSMDTAEAILRASITYLAERLDERREELKYIKDNPNEFNYIKFDKNTTEG